MKARTLKSLSIIRGTKCRDPISARYAKRVYVLRTQYADHNFGPFWVKNDPKTFPGLKGFARGLFPSLHFGFTFEFVLKQSSVDF